LVRAFEDLLSNSLPVDGSGDGLTTQLTLFVITEVLERIRDRHCRIDRTGLVNRLDGFVFFEGGQSTWRDLIADVEYTGLNIGIRCLGIGIELKGDATVLRLAIAVVVRVRLQLGFNVMIPRFQGIGAVSDRLLAEGIHVLERRLRQREVARIAEAVGKVRSGTLELDSESRIVLDFEA